MADAAVSFLLENVTQLLIRDVGLIQGVGDEIKLLKVELALIHRFLCASKGKRELVKEVVNEIRSMAHEAEDVIDTFVVDVAMHKRRNTLDRYVHKLDHNLMLRGVASKIKSIKNQIAAIYRSKDKYGIVQDDDSRSEALMRRESLHSRRRKVEEVEVVSFVEDMKIVMGMMCTSDRHLDVVSIVGMGGLGKTTLAKKIYNDRSAESRFNFRAWANVSEEFRPRDVLLQILQSFTSSVEGIHEMGEDSLALKLRSCLQDKKYLIVLDDVWKPEVWIRIKEAFPDRFNGSRILVTSRIKEVALSASTTPPYLLPLLNKDDSWELLSKKAFRGASCPPTLESNGRKIAEKCRGLPLALVVVGGLLATRQQSNLVWSQMVANVSWYLEKNPESFSDVLALSYQELPSYLKPCFLYLGVYPEDFRMSARQLIMLWVAEGLIEQDTGRMPEEIADEYLEDLADRSLIKVVDRRSDRGIKSFMIHDLLRDMCISEAAQDNFFVVHNGESFIKSSSSNRPRRISLHKYNFLSIGTDSSVVRSLVCFGRNEEKIPPFIFQDLRLLRVLDVGALSPSSKGLSPKFEKLVLLRYLRIGELDLKSIPSFICNLPNLQTLDLRKSSIRNLGDHFWNMQQLRHFFVKGPCELSPSHSPSDIKTMRNLQTLSGVGSGLVYCSDIDIKTAFPNLRKLKVKKSERYDDRQKDRSQSNFEGVQTLKIIWSMGLYPLGGLSSAHIIKLTLFETRLHASDFASISLPNLEILKLLKNSLTFDSCRRETNKTFSKLEVIHMIGMDITRCWIDDKCLSNLRFLQIQECVNMHMAPKRLKYVTTLCHVKVTQCSHTLQSSFLELGLGKNTRLQFDSNDQVIG